MLLGVLDIFYDVKLRLNLIIDVYRSVYTSKLVNQSNGAMISPFKSAGGLAHVLGLKDGGQSLFSSLSLPCKGIVYSSYLFCCRVILFSLEQRSMEF